MTDITANIPDAQLERIGAKIVSTLSRQLTWSHLVELSVIPESNKRLFYQQMSILNHWSVRKLRDQEDAMAYERTLIAAKPEDEQAKVLTNVTKGEISPDVIIKSSYIVDFAFLERQKKIPVDSTDHIIFP